MGLLRRARRHNTPLIDRRALVIGGSGGIGAAVSVQLAGAGATVVCHGGHNRQRAAATVQAIERTGGTASAVVQPLDSPGEVAELLHDARPIDILVVAFGPVHYGPIATTNAAAWTRMVRLNLELPGLATALALPGMIERHYGRIVYFGGPGCDAIRGYTRIGAYATAKIGLGVLAKSVAVQAAAHNVAANVIAPGYVATEYLSERERATYRKRSPIGRPITPEALARFTLPLITQIDPDVNGAVVAFDQGRS